MLADDPQLTVRLPGLAARAAAARVARCSPPARVLAGRRALPERARVLAGAAPSLSAHPAAAAAAAPRSRTLATLPRDERDVQSLLVEGGATIHGAFIAAGLVDRVALLRGAAAAGRRRPDRRAAPAAAWRGRCGSGRSPCAPSVKTC